MIFRRVPDSMKQTVKMVVASCSFVQFFIIIDAFYLRLRHNGRVCSGDYLKDGASKDGYLI